VCKPVEHTLKQHLSSAGPVFMSELDVDVNARSPDKTRSSTATRARPETPGYSAGPLRRPPGALRARSERWKRRSAHRGPARPPRPPSSLPIPPRTHSASRDAKSLCVLTYWPSHVTPRSLGGNSSPSYFTVSQRKLKKKNI